MRKTTFFTTLAALVLTATQAFSWTTWGTKDGDKKMYLSVDTGYSSCQYNAMKRGAQSWNAVGCSGFTFRQDNPVKIDRPVPSKDGRSHITYSSAGGALAVTYLMNNSSSRECDMIIDNGVNFNCGPDASRWNEYDLEGVVCHEEGHMLGLGHSSVQAATMYYAIGAGDDSKRSLHQDDIDGVCYLY